MMVGRKKTMKIHLQANADEIRRQKPKMKNLAATANPDAATANRDAATANRDAATANPDAATAVHDAAQPPNVRLEANI